MNAREAFVAAVESGDPERVRRTVEEHPELRDRLDEPWFAFDSPAIVRAAGMRSRALLDALLDLGADIDARSSWAAGPYSALHSLVDGATPQSLALADHLVQRGATLDVHAAAGLGRIDDLAAMLDEEPGRVSEPGPDGATPLHLAKNVDVVELLIRRGAVIDQRCVDHKSTAAQWALGDRPQVTRLLLEHGAHSDLFMAAVLDDVAMAEEILSREPDAIDVRVQGGHSHEHLGHGDKYVWTLNFAETPLEAARRRGNDALYGVLLAAAGPAARLVQASRRSDLDEVNALLAEHTGLLESLDEDATCAALCGSAGAAEILLEAGADPSVRNRSNGATPLHLAAFHGDAALVDALLAGGADPMLRDHTYEGTPQGWARAGGRHGLARTLAAEEARREPDAPS